MHRRSVRVPVQAHGGGVMEHNGVYYWYGEDKNGETFKPLEHHVRPS